MVRMMFLVTLLALASASPAAAVITIASSQAIPAAATAPVPASSAGRPAPAIDAGFGELIAAAIGLAILMFALSINRDPQRVAA